MNNYRKLSCQFLENYLLCTLPSDVTKDEFNRFSLELLEELQSQKPEFLILDYSLYQIMDKVEFDRIKNLIKQVSLMGIQSICHGLKPGVVSGLVELIDSFDDLQFTINLAAAIELTKL